MNPLLWLFIALGGASGACLRAATGLLIRSSFPWATLCANVLGSILIGWLLARVGPLNAENARIHAGWITGFCGGFTTFSSFSLQTVDQIQRGHAATALGYVAMSLLFCLGGTWIGLKIGR